VNQASNIWAITAYYNPFHLQSRLTNYKIFRSQLALPLLTIEQAFAQESDLTSADADILLRVDEGALLWQKERLLNHALTLLPDEAQIVVWLDCDLVFGQAAWFYHLPHLLRQYRLVHCFSDIVDLDKQATVEFYAQAKRLTDEPELSVRSISSAKHTEAEYHLHGVSPGGAWAARRDFIQRFGLYDAMVCGGADRAFYCACFGQFEDALSIARLEGRRAEHYLRWANPFFAVVQGDVAQVEGQLLHLWHGNRRERGYLTRHNSLAKIYFDPYEDIAVGPSSSWEWTTSASAELKDFVRNYLASRLEDG
jgi:hypothetical protein